MSALITGKLPFADAVSNLPEYAEIVECALCASAGLAPAVLAKQFSEPVVAAAGERGMRGYSLGELLLDAAAQNGLEVGARRRVHGGNLQAVLKHAFGFPAIKGTSTIDVAGILSNVANKVLVDGFNVVPQTWREVAHIASAKDFKPNTFYRLTDSLEYEQLPASGKIPEGSLGEDSYEVSLRTFARMITLSRTQIINDDLGALATARERLGMGAAITLANKFWIAWLAASAAGDFWSAINGNLVENQNLDEAGLAAAIHAWSNLQTSGPFSGLTPDRLLCGSTASPTARKWFAATELRDTANNLRYLTTNIYAGQLRPVVAPQLDSASFDNCATTWWVAGNPEICAPATVVFLDGKESPTIESSNADFDVLGIQFRGYHDFGITVGTERVASVKVTAPVSP